jgi:hypothetical protein
MNIFVALEENKQAVVTVEYRPVRSHLERSGLARVKGCFDGFGREMAKNLQFHWVDAICGMKKLQLWTI